MRLSFVWLPVAVSVAVCFSACLEATQVTFDITTDVPCDRLGGTTITIGLEGQTEKAPANQTVTDCAKDGTVHAIGTFAVTPKKNTDVVASLKVAMAVGADVSVATVCTAANGYHDCIVARRRVSFLPHRGLTVPVDLLLVCKDVQCDESSSCNAAGRCVTSLIDLNKCDGDVCSAPVTKPGEGLPCFNEAGSTATFCSGNESWCTRSASGMKGCAKQPGGTGVSFECRDARDCGPNLMCVAGTDGVLGRCTPMATPGDTLLCTLGETMSPCPGGPRQCYVDAGPGLFTCASTDGGTSMNGGTDGGLRCPRSGNLVCSGATPYCSIVTGTPSCVAHEGAQCWYPSDCPAGNGCYAGVTASFFNACLPTPTAENNVPLCNEALGGRDCPPGYACDGVFYGFRACRPIPPSDGGVTDAGVDAGSADAGDVDAGLSDAGTADSGIDPDAGTADAGDGG